MTNKINTVLKNIQSELKAPKGQRNTFWNYNYRSCEDILEAVKPLLNKNEAILTITDDIIMLWDRFYVKATATLKTDEGEISVNWLARESLTKKWMDDSQITWATSSYARKYALNWLFAIDDTKDADTMDNRKEDNKKTFNNGKPDLKDFIDRVQDESDENALWIIYKEAEWLGYTPKQMAWLAKECGTRKEYLQNNQ